MMLAVYSLTQRELVRFFRQRNRVIGAFAQPLIFWVLFGMGLRGSFDKASSGGASYMEYFVPGVLAMILLFTAIFSTISIIEDRREGFLQSVLVAPVPRAGLVLGKLLGGTVLAVLQGVLFMVLAFLTQRGLVFDPLRAAWLTGAMALIAFSLVGLGFLIAWKSESTQGFHAVMSVFLFPMWLLSGAFFPVTAETPAWLAWIVALNPMTYGVALLRHALYPAGERALPGIPELPVSLGVTAAFALLMFVCAQAVSVRRVQGDLQ